MTGSISAIVTMGFGSFGSINLLPTIGYGTGTAVILVNGPLIFPAATIYRPGGMAGTRYTPGAKQATIYRPGAMEGMAD